MSPFPQLTPSALCLPAFSLHSQLPLPCLLSSSQTSLCSQLWPHSPFLLHLCFSFTDFFFGFFPRLITCSTTSGYPAWFPPLFPGLSPTPPPLATWPGSPFYLPASSLPIASASQLSSTPPRALPLPPRCLFPPWLSGPSILLACSHQPTATPLIFLSPTLLPPGPLSTSSVAFDPGSSTPPNLSQLLAPLSHLPAFCPQLATATPYLLVFLLA